jgi:hypothetical protein
MPMKSLTWLKDNAKLMTVLGFAAVALGMCIRSSFWIGLGVGVAISAWLTYWDAKITE